MTMSASSQQTPQPAADLPIEVHLRLAKSMLSLQRLAAIAPGDILQLTTGFPRAQAVAAGSVFAEVEIVESAGAAMLRVRALNGE